MTVDEYATQDIILDTGTGSDTVNMTTAKLFYTTPLKVAKFLGVTPFTFAGTPSLDHVMDEIKRAGEYIENKTDHSWRASSITDEYHELDLRYLVQDGRTVWLKHRWVKTLSNAEGDKIEVFDGSNWINYVTDKTEDRNGGDFWVNYTDGILFIRLYNYTRRKWKVRATYRYGDPVLPADITEAATKLAAMNLISSEDRTIILPEGAGSMGNSSKIAEWRVRVESIIRNYMEFRTVGT